MTQMTPEHYAILIAFIGIIIMVSCMMYHCKRKFNTLKPKDMHDQNYYVDNNVYTV